MVSEYCTVQCYFSGCQKCSERGVAEREEVGFFSEVLATVLFVVDASRRNRHASQHYIKNAHTAVFEDLRSSISYYVA